MNLLQNEELLMNSDDKSVLLTNKRVVMDSKIWGKSNKIFIFLEDISSVEVHYKSYPLLLILSVVSMIVIVFLREIPPIAGIGLALLFAVGWLITRKHTIQINSNGGASIDIYIKGMSDETIGKFIHKLQQAKSDRLSN